MLTTGLENTPGWKIADPWALWRSLRPQRSARAESPDPVEADRLAKQAGAERFALGSIAELDGRLAITVRVYQVGRTSPEFSLAANHPRDSLAALVSDVQLQIMNRVVKDPVSALPKSLQDVMGTQSPEALKALLVSREAVRRGQFYRADSAIKRAIKSDSNFVAALIEQAIVASWVQFLQGTPYSDQLPALTRAVSLVDTQNTRHRLRASAMLGATLTDGRQCVDGGERLVSMDSTDIRAWDLLRYCLTVYGWQLGRSTEEAVLATEKVLRLDSTFAPALISRVWLARTPTDQRRQLQRLSRADTSAPGVRNAITSTRLLLASQAQFETMLRGAAGWSRDRQVSAIRTLREENPKRAMQFASALTGTMRAGVLVQLYGAQARTSLIDSIVRLSTPPVIPRISRTGDMTIATAALAGIGDSAVAHSAVNRLMLSLPVDSAQARFSKEAVWDVGWVIAAFHAALGDTSLSRRWYANFEAWKGGGGSPPLWAEALQADIDARLAVRRGDTATALAFAERAFERWNIHTENVLENHPEPSIRLHLALLYRAQGQSRRAEPLLASLQPKVTWFGFVTTRASLELGELELARGDTVRAAQHFRYALDFWSSPESEPWRSRAQEGLRKATRAAGP